MPTLTTKLSVKFPLILEYTNHDYLDYAISAFNLVFDTPIKDYHLGDVDGDELTLLYVKKLPTDKQLFKLLKDFNKFESDAEIKYFMKEGTVIGFVNETV